MVSALERFHCIMQVLRKLPLSTLDTLLFNDARSGQRDLQCYDALELIKVCSAVKSVEKVDTIGTMN